MKFNERSFRRGRGGYTSGARGGHHRPNARGGLHKYRGKPYRQLTYETQKSTYKNGHNAKYDIDADWASADTSKDSVFEEQNYQFAPPNQVSIWADNGNNNRLGSDTEWPPIESASNTTKEK